jgi:hypothetical protein
MLARLQSRQQPVRAFGLFGRAPDHAANQEELRIVAAMQLGMDSFHATAPGKPTLEAKIAQSSRSQSKIGSRARAVRRIASPDIAEQDALQP